MVYKEIATTDKEGNSWKLRLTQDPKKTNRFIFSFFLNEKEFCLSKIQNKRTADMTWELLDKIRKTPQESVKGGETGEESVDTHKIDSKPKKRASKPKEEEPARHRPKKRVKK